MGDTRHSGMKDLEVIDLVSSSSSEDDTGQSVRKRTHQHQNRDRKGTKKRRSNATHDANTEVTFVQVTNHPVLKQKSLEEESPKPSSMSTQDNHPFDSCVVQSDDQTVQRVTYGMEEFVSSLNSSSTIFLVSYQDTVDSDIPKIPPLIHCAQNDQWSCGYQNIQMILGSIVPLLPKHHVYFQRTTATATTTSTAISTANPKQIRIPSISQIQQQMEYSWNEHFDPEGAKHFSNTIYNTTKRLGAVEVASLFSFWYLDTTVLQFARTTVSRRCLVPFVGRYFSVPRQTQTQSTNTNDGNMKRNDRDSGIGIPSSYSIAMSILSQICPTKIKTNRDNFPGQLVSAGTMTPTRIGNVNRKECLPLFLQWEGHSVTIIGIEVNGSPKDFLDGSTMNPKDVPTLNLLVLDPLKSMTGWRHAAPSSNRNEKLLGTMRLPISKVIKKDCQIVLPSTTPLEEMTRMRYRHTARTIHAFAE